MVSPDLLWEIRALSHRERLTNLVIFVLAGIPIHSLSSSNTSMFSGTYGKDYHDLTVKDPEIIPASFITGNGSAMLSNRISHFYDLRGASATIDTGCSSGLVALHQACRSIQAGESDLSIVGASSMLINPDLFIAMSSQGLGFYCFIY